MNLDYVLYYYVLSTKCNKFGLAIMATSLNYTKTKEHIINTISAAGLNELDSIQLSLIIWSVPIVIWLCKWYFIIYYKVFIQSITSLFNVFIFLICWKFIIFESQSNKNDCTIIFKKLRFPLPCNPEKPVGRSVDQTWELWQPLIQD